MLKRISKKITALVMTLALVVSIMPVMTLTARAADVTASISTSGLWVDDLNAIFNETIFSGADNIVAQHLVADAGGDPESANLYIIGGSNNYDNENLGFNDTPFICDGTETLKFTASTPGIYSFELYYDKTDTIKQITITVTEENTAPVVSNLDGDNVSYTENGDPVLLDSGSDATVTDIYSADFDGGNVTVTITGNYVSSEDVLSIQNQVTGTEKIGVSDNNVTYNYHTIGTFSGGSGDNPLVVSLNSNATPDNTSALIRALTYKNKSDNPSTATRTVSITVDDGDGGTSNNSDVTVSVTAINDAPIDITLSNSSIDNKAAADSVIGTFSTTDLDSTDFTYLLVSGSGDTDNASFYISGNTLYINTSPDYKTKSSYSIRVRTSDGKDKYDKNFNITVNSLNNAPTVSGLPSSITATEDKQSDIDLSNATFSDADGDSLTVTLAASAGTFTASSVGGVTVSGSGSTLTIAGTAADINAFLDTTSNIKYTGDLNAYGTAAATFTVRADDGIGVQQLGTVNIDITPVNDPPTLSVTASYPTFAEGGSGVVLFIVTSASTVEPDQKITQLILTVSDLSDGSNEILSVDGTDIPLVNGSSSTTNNNLNCSVSVAGNTATLTFTSSDGISAEALQTIVNGIKYRNSSSSPTIGNRVVTLVEISDNGGTANGGEDTTYIFWPSTVTITAVPSAPAIGTATAGNEQATVTFTAPASNGGSAITSYTVTSNPGGLTGTGTTSPITVTGLTNGVAYTFTVTATNANGTSAASAASNSVTPAPQTQQEETPNIQIDYENHKITGFTAGAGYKINSTAITPATSSIDINVDWFGTDLSIVKEGNGTTTTDSEAQMLTIPSKPSAPSAAGVNETYSNANDGKITGVDSTMEYSTDNANWTPVLVTEITGLSAGSYYVRVMAVTTGENKAFASPEVIVTVGTTASEKETQPSIQIDYKNELITGFTAGAGYKINSTAITPATSSLDINNDWFGTDISIVKKGNGTTTTDSDAQMLTIPSKPSAPSAAGVNEAYSNANDGKITGVDSTMEYSTDQTNWTPVSETEITGLSDGTYYVRVKAVTTGENKAFASAIKTVTVGTDNSVQETTPNIQLDFGKEKLTGFTTGAAYTINGITTAASLSIDIDNDWFGSTISIVKKGNGTTTTDSDAQMLPIPSRPQKPSAEIIVNKNANSIMVTNTNDFSGCEYSTDGVNWKNNGTFTGLNSGTEYTIYVRVKATDTSFCSMPVTANVITDGIIEGTGSVSGTVTNESSISVSSAAVKVTKNGTDGAAIAQTVTDENGNFTISNLAYGIYSLVVTKDSKVITKTITINKASVTQNVTIPSGYEDTEVELVGDTPSVAAENLENMFTADDKETAKTDSVKIKLVVEKESADNISAENKAKIAEKLASSGKLGIYLDLQLQKIINDGTPESIQPPTGQKVKITISIPTELQNKAPYSIIRVHNGVAEILNADYNSEFQTLTFETDKFSTYAVTYTNKSSGSSGSESSTSLYTITARAQNGGSISPSGSVSVQNGEYKKYTITPDDGYSIEDVIVDGDSVGAVESYVFSDIDEDHTIKAVFKEKSGTEVSDTDFYKDYKDNKDADKEFGNPFKDVTENDWFNDAVLNVYKKGIMSGISENEFGPNLSTTRGMIAEILYRIDKTNEKVDSTFTDVAKDKYYYNAIGWAEKNSIINGYGNGKYGPDDKITREQLVSILWRYEDSPKTENYNNLKQFSDYSSISDYAKPALEWAFERGIITGKGNNTLDPKGLATRAETAKILSSYLEIREN